MKFSDFVDKVSDGGHIPLAFFMFCVGSGIHVYHGLDATYVTFTTTILGFLGGHAYINSNTPPTPPTPPAG